MRPARPSFPSSKKIVHLSPGSSDIQFVVLPSSPLSLKGRLAADCPNLGPPVVQLVAASSLFLARLVFHEGGSSSNSIPHHVPNLGGVASRGLLESTTFFSRLLTATTPCNISWGWRQPTNLCSNAPCCSSANWPLTTECGHHEASALSNRLPSPSD